MTTRFKLMLVIMVLACGTVRAQGPWPQERPDERQQTVTNEDGGQAFIVKPAAFAMTAVMKPGASSISELEQHSIFLGGGWADPALRVRESRLSNLLTSIRDQAQLDEVEQAGVKNRFGATFGLEKLDVTSNRAISDLEIQDVLAGMFNDGSLTPPNAAAIYIVFLDSGLHSTLGPLVADKHYMAYHGFLYVSGEKVHYAVVPFQSNANAQYKNGLRTLVVAALHSAEDTSH
jgi:hypothetical protein